MAGTDKCWEKGAILKGFGGGPIRSEGLLGADGFKDIDLLLVADNVNQRHVLGDAYFVEHLA